MGELTSNQITSLRVTELRKELAARGLPTDGTKPVLVQRLVDSQSKPAVDDSVTQLPDANPPLSSGGASLEATQQDSLDGDILDHTESDRSTEEKESRPADNHRDMNPASDQTECRSPAGKAEANVKSEEDASLPTIVLDEYNCDLHAVVGPSGATTRCDCAGFANMWAGVRASHGVGGGKVCFEVTVEMHITGIKLLDDTPEHLQHLARFGWSALSLDYTLGESCESYGYGGTGKASVDNSFQEYGETFGKGDTITCYLDLESPSKTISYAKNGKYLGVAFTLDELSGRPLFPHVLLKNVDVSVNFGDEPPGHALEEGYVMMQDAVPSMLRRGPVAPASFQECKVKMTVGLPAAGKTTWAKKYQREHPEERFTILGTNAIMDQMRVHNLLRKRNYHGRFEQLMESATKVHNKLLEVARLRKRNFILDQTNVYTSARRRKMANFGQFGERQAVVVVVSPEELERRAREREQVEGKLVPDHAVVEMKRNFNIPTLKEGFTAIVYAEEAEEAAKSIVERSQKVSWETDSSRQKESHGGPPAKRPIPDRDAQAAPSQAAPSLLGEYQQQWRDGPGPRDHCYRDSSTSKRPPLIDRPPLLDSRSAPRSYRGGRDYSHSRQLGNQRDAPSGPGAPNHGRPLMETPPRDYARAGGSASRHGAPAGGYGKRQFGSSGRGGHGAGGAQQRSASVDKNAYGGGSSQHGSTPQQQQQQQQYGSTPQQQQQYGSAAAQYGTSTAAAGAGNVAATSGLYGGSQQAAPVYGQYGTANSAAPNVAGQYVPFQAVSTAAAPAASQYASQPLLATYAYAQQQQQQQGSSSNTPAAAAAAAAAGYQYGTPSASAQALELAAASLAASAQPAAAANAYAQAYGQPSQSGYTAAAAAAAPGSAGSYAGLGTGVAWNAAGPSANAAAYNLYATQASGQGAYQQAQAQPDQQWAYYNTPR